jgi:hypothetical protein
MRNSLNPTAVGFFALGIIVALNTIIGATLFYSSDNVGGDPLYFQYSLTWNPFGYWLIILSLLAFGVVAQLASDYHAYLYESKTPWVSSSLLYTLAVLLLLMAAGDFIFQLYVEMTARGQLALASMRQAEYGMNRSMDSVLLVRTFPYNLLQYVVPVGHALTGVLLIGAAPRIAALKLDAATVTDTSEVASNA